MLPSGDDFITEMLDKARKILAQWICATDFDDRSRDAHLFFLRNGIGADGAASAFLAKITEIKLIDLFHHRVEMSGIVGQKSRFKVAFVWGLCPESCARQIG